MRYLLMAGPLLVVIAGAVFWFLNGGPARGEERGFSLQFPVDCLLGQTCWIYQYPDQDPSSGWQDYRGGRMSYDNHKGTDIGVEDIDELPYGIPVLAARDGVVLRTRDGVADRVVTEETRAAVTQIGCGNAVVIGHGEGWTTIYCHLLKGSLLVKSDQKVKAGQPIAFMGLSGLTEFPHLEFQVRKNNQVIDPTAESLWADAKIRESYGPVILHAGFATQGPTLPEIIAGGHEPETLSQGAGGNLLFYATVLGAAPGQSIEMTLKGPNGRILAEDTSQVDRPQILRTLWLGVRDIASRAPGNYTGEARLSVKGAPATGKTSTVELLP